MRKLAALILALLIPPLSAGAGEEEISRMRLPLDEWFNLMISGVKVGYAHNYTELVEKDGQKLLRIRSEMRMKVRRMSSSLEISQTRESLLDISLTPKRFISSITEPSQTRRAEGWIEDGRARLRLELDGEVHEETIDLPDNVIFEEALGYYALLKGMKVGESRQLSLFSLELLKPIPVEIRVLRRDKVRYKGEERPVYVVSYRIKIMGGLENVEWIGEDGVTYRMEMSGLMGLKMELVKTDMADALGEVGELDVIINTKLFPSGEPIFGHPLHLKAKVSLSEGDLEKAFMRTDEQKLVKLGDGEGLLLITRKPISEEEAPLLPIKDPELAEFLSPTLYIQADDPEIVEKAREIIGDERNSWRAAKLICRWVYENIRDKSLRVGFGSAKTTLETLQGDCTEHTVLFIALARAVGLPARICAGLVYHRDAFYYHFWPEVYVGRWVQMDPTLGEYQADATHIMLAGGKLESDTALEYGEGVLRTLNRLTIEVLEAR